MSKPNSSNRLPAYTPAEQIEIAATEAAEQAARDERLRLFHLACEHNDAEGEAY